MTNRSSDIGASGVTSIMGGEQYRPYPAYKDSGAEWLGEIPTQWRFLPQSECVASPTIAPSERSSRITSSTNISAATAKPRSSSNLDQVQPQ